MRALLFTFLVLFTSTLPIAIPSASAQKTTYAVQSVRMLYSTTNVTTAAWVQLIASLNYDVTRVEIFDSSGQTLMLGLGASGSESNYFDITPGGNGMVDAKISKGSRISLRALSSTASSGEITINFYQF